MRPGLANAFLLGFIESMADFGNPLVLGGNFDVLSTEIFFAIVGAQNDPALAAILAVVLLVFTLGAFYAQRFWLGRRSYTTVSGKGDAGIHPLLPRPLRAALYAVVGCWVALTLVVYGTIVYGSFVKLWGVDMTPDARPLREGLRASAGPSTASTGAAPPGRSFWTTIWIALVSAPLTAAIGLLTAWLLVRQDFARQARLRVRDDALLRDPGHGDRRLLRHRLQRAADRADRHRHHPRDLLHLPQHAGRGARRRSPRCRRSTEASTRAR